MSQIRYHYFVQASNLNMMLILQLIVIILIIWYFLFAQKIKSNTKIGLDHNSIRENYKTSNFQIKWFILGNCKDKF